MAEIDPVILQLRADVAKYRVDVENTTRRVNTQLDSQGQAVVRLERQFSASSAKISTSVRAIATSLAAGFSAREVAAMADSYTRFTNQLKVAGLEGGNLAGTQERLFQVAQKNGVELEAVGTLYSRAAQNQKELGASTSDLVDLTRAVSASLRISGTSTNEASGALLQLGQALGSPRVQAEEFNSLLDTMQPLLRQASQYIDGTGGSLAGLTQKIKDTKGPGVSNVELFRAIIRAMSDLEKQAASTTLTISGAFTNLTNAITKFVGETDSANGATAAITGALNLLAENLDTVTEAIAVLSAIMLGRFVAGMAAGAVSTAGASTAIFALQARAAGAATTMEALAFTGSAAGRSLLAAFGGPVGVAVLALGAGIYGLSKYTEGAAIETDEYRTKVEQATKADETASELALQLATARGTERKAVEAAARAEIERTKRTIEAAKADVAAAKAALEKARSLQAAQNTAAASAGGTVPGATAGIMRLTGERGVNQARNALTNQQKLLDGAEARLRTLESSLTSPSVGSLPAGSPAKPKAAKSRTSTRTGPDPDELARRFADDLAQGEMAIKQAQADALGTAEARRGLHADQIEYERQRNARQIAADKDLTNAQREQLLQQNERIAEAQRQAVGADALREAQERQKHAAENQAQYAEEAMRADASLATTRQASLEANLRILDSLEAQEKSHLEAQILAGEIVDAEKARADLARSQAARRTTTQQDHESPLASYSRKLNETDVGDAVEGYVVDELKSVQDSIGSGLQKAIGTKDPLISGLINLFIQQVIMQPIAAALAQATASSGGGGIARILGSVVGAIGSAFGSGSSSSYGGTWINDPNAIPHFAAGTNYAPGGVALVGENGPELVDLPRGSKVVPNHMLNARAAASMAGVTAAGVSSRPVQQNVTNYYGPGAKEFWGQVDGRASSVATPISQRYAAQAGQAAYKQSMKDAPGSVRRAQRFRTSS